MIIDIPGKGVLNIKNVVFDYNGTIAVNGIIKESIKENLIKLKEEVNIYVLTADTYGFAKAECEKLGIKILTFPKEGAGKFKDEIVEGIGYENTICVGNGFNDIEMCKKAALSIGVIDEEGIASSLIGCTDIIANGIESAINILLNKNRVIATLRT